MDKFKVGQTVVHLSHGVGVINSIEKREFSEGKIEKFYVLVIDDNGAPKKVFVPVTVANERIRSIFTKKQAQEVLDYIATGKPFINHQTWNRRFREYMEKLHTGDTMQVAEVYVALRSLKDDKDLSFGERKLLDQASNLLRDEFAAAGVKIELT